MNNKILFLIPILLFVVPSLAYAEMGFNYDIVELSANSGKWTSHYDRIWDGSKWVNYIWSQDTNKIKFDSANISYEFDKTDCSFSLFEPLTNKKMIKKYERSLKVNGLDVTLSECEILGITNLEDTMEIISKQNGGGSELKTIYDIGARGFEEWTHEITNTDIFTSKIYEIKETCLDCNVKKLNDNPLSEDLIYFDGYTLDTKNKIHNKLKTKIETKDFELIYEDTAKGFLEKTIIDPTFSNANVITDAYVFDTNNNDVCETSGGTYARFESEAALYVGDPDNTFSFDCSFAYFGWDLSGIPGTVITVTDSRFKWDALGFSGAASSCDITGHGNDFENRTVALQHFDAYTPNGTVFINNGVFCLATGDNQDTDLGTAADTYMVTHANSDNEVWISVAPDKTNNFLAPFGGKLGAGSVPDPTLEILYTYGPDIVQTQTINILENIGDVVRLGGLVTINNSTASNLTSIKLFINGTLTNTNSTGQNKTGANVELQTNYGPIWYQMDTSQVYNFTIQSSVQNITSTYLNASSTFYTREYGPTYFTAADPTQGTVNYTFVPSNTVQVNRDKDGAIFSIECGYITQSDAFFNNLNNINWDNVSTLGFYSYQYTGYYYVTCYNDGELFTTILNQNYSNYLVPGMVIFDELGGFIGAPSIILVIIAILSLATGRNFPIIIIIAVSVTGIMGALELVTFDPSIWAALIIIAIITVFGARRFY